MLQQIQIRGHGFVIVIDLFLKQVWVQWSYEVHEDRVTTSILSFDTRLDYLDLSPVLIIWSP